MTDNRNLYVGTSSTKVGFFKNEVGADLVFTCGVEIEGRDGLKGGIKGQI